MLSDKVMELLEHIQNSLPLGSKNLAYSMASDYSSSCRYCSGECSGDCKGDCLGSCSGGCDGRCEGDCSGSCSDSCDYGCQDDAI